MNKQLFAEYSNAREKIGRSHFESNRAELHCTLSNASGIKAISGGGFPSRSLLREPMLKLSQEVRTGCWRNAAIGSTCITAPACS